MPSGSLHGPPHGTGARTPPRGGRAWGRAGEPVQLGISLGPRPQPPVPCSTPGSPQALGLRREPSLALLWPRCSRLWPERQLENSRGAPSHCILIWGRRQHPCSNLCVPRVPTSSAEKPRPQVPPGGGRDDVTCVVVPTQWVRKAGCRGQRTYLKALGRWP